MGLFRKKKNEKMKDPSEILEYWEASDKEACGNCMHFSYPMFGKPICNIPDFLIPEGCPTEKINTGKEMDPGDNCLFWARRK